MATSTFTRNAGGSGRIVGTTSAVWATIHDAATGTSTSIAGQIVTQLDLGNYDIFRYYCTFDTSTLGAGAVISSAFLRLIATGGTEEGAGTIVVVASTQASSTALDVADWN